MDNQGNSVVAGPPRRPARSLDAVCNLDQSDCIRRLCPKISVAIDDPQWCELVGDEAIDELDGPIRTARYEG